MWIEVTTIGHLVDRGAERHGDRDAVVFPDTRLSYVELSERVTVEDLGYGATRVIIHTGYMERPHVPAILAKAHLNVDRTEPTYFLGRETFVVGKGGNMGVLSEGLFAFLSRNAKSPTSWFSIPPEQVIEVGMQLDL